MNKGLLGFILGALVVFTPAYFGQENYIDLIESQNVEINKMGNEIAQLEMAVNDLLIENAKLSEQIK